MAKRNLGWVTFSLLITVFTTTLFSASMVGCASKVNKGEVAANANPMDEITSLESDMKAGYAAQYDILAPKEFANAQKAIDKAREQVKSEAKQEKIIETIAYARGYYNKTKDLAEGRQASVQGVLDARKAALDAGARQFPKENDSLKAIDDNFRDAAERKTIEPKEFADLQTRYLALELAAIQSTQLGSARAIVASASKNGATKNTPKTLNKAELAIANAQNVITANRHNESGYRTAVISAVESARLLEAVLAQTKRPGGEVASEEVALKLVGQSRKIMGLNGELGTAEAQASEQNATLAAQNAKLKTATAAISLDQALEEGRGQFSKDEAEVYRQGDKLVIRLKKIQFPSGRSDLPAESLDLLAKVNKVATELNPSQVVVQGHTDAVGSAEKNLTLSQSRAEAVAKYLSTNGIDAGKVEAVGFGFKKPLASNKTKDGRAQNRRVDIIITPGSSNAAPEAM